MTKSDRYPATDGPGSGRVCRGGRKGAGRGNRPLFLGAKTGVFVCTSEPEPVPLPRSKRGAYFVNLNHLSKLPADFMAQTDDQGETGKSLRTKEEYGAHTEKRNE